MTGDLQTARSPAALQTIFRSKYGEAPNWGPRLRRSFRHFTPDDVYEALVDQLVQPGSKWLDVGCGRELFPSHKTLARRLADRCELLVGVDPDETLAENPYVHERVRAVIDDFESPPRFDLVTMRMVAEHVEHPEKVIHAVSRCLLPGGLAVVYTVNGWSPIPLLTRVAPMWLVHRVKSWLWRTDAKDTFPTKFRMNSRRRLRKQFAAGGLTEVGFGYLDDCRTTGRFKLLQYLELSVFRGLRTVGICYPENCLLGVYRKREPE